MDLRNDPLAVIFGLLAGMMLATLTARWIHGVWTAVADPRARSGERPSSTASGLVAAVALHSGPWALAIAAAVSWRILSKPHEPWWSAFFAGACAGPLLLAVLVFVAARRRKQPPTPYLPLTDAGLAAARKRFLLYSTVIYGGAGAVIMMFGMAHPPIALMATVPIWLAGGYVFALVMWQWKKAQLQSIDAVQRKRAETPPAVTVPL